LPRLAAPFAALRTRTCSVRTPTVGDRDFVTLTDPAAALAVGDAVDFDFVAPLFFDADGLRLPG